MTIERQGVLERDEAWEGDIRVTGDILIPEGRRLAIQPGCRITFSENPGWVCSVFRSADEGYPIETSYREACDFIVQGRLEAFGTAQSPIQIGSDGVSWGGLVVFKRGEIVLRHAGIHTNAEFALQAFDDSSVTLNHCVFERSRVGIWTNGLSRLTASDVVIRASDCGIQCAEGSRVEIARVDIVDSPQGCSCRGYALLDAQDCRFVRTRDFDIAVSDTVRARIQRCDWQRA